jgi:hypothetical protein
MDELPPDARDITKEYNQNVGLISCKRGSVLRIFLGNIRQTDKHLFSTKAEGSEGFSEFHLYVCAAFLVKWSNELKKMDFQGIMMFLQSVPTSNWDEKDVELLLSEAFMWKSLFHNAQSHLAVAIK